MKRLIILGGIITSFAISFIAYGHSGGLDKNSCHTNKQLDEYHCHDKQTEPIAFNVTKRDSSYVHKQIDDPATTDDESNNQPLGLFGTEIVKACTTHNERCYTLDAQFDDKKLVKVYFVKGGRLKFKDNQCASMQICRVKGQNGREWLINRDTK